MVSFLGRAAFLYKAKAKKRLSALFIGRLSQRQGREAPAIAKKRDSNAPEVRRNAITIRPVMAMVVIPPSWSKPFIWMQSLRIEK